MPEHLFCISSSRSSRRSSSRDTAEYSLFWMVLEFGRLKSISYTWFNTAFLSPSAVSMSLWHISVPSSTSRLSRAKLSDRARALSKESIA